MVIQVFTWCDLETGEIERGRIASGRCILISRIQKPIYLSRISNIFTLLCVYTVVHAHLCRFENGLNHRKVQGPDLYKPECKQAGTYVRIMYRRCVEKIASRQEHMCALCTVVVWRVNILLCLTCLMMELVKVDPIHYVFV